MIDLNTDKKIFVLDDDIASHEILEFVFERISPHLKPTFFDNTEGFLGALDQVAADQLPHLLLLDINLPRFGGIYALEKVRAMPAFQHIPILVFSTTENKKEIRECYALGANGFFVKADSLADFEVKLKSIFEYWFATILTP